MRTLATIALVLASTVCCRADGPKPCTSGIDRMSILQGIAKKGVEDQAKLKTYSMSEIQLDPRPLCDVLVDNIDLGKEMLTEQQMCQDQTSPEDLKRRENTANTIIMWQQQLAQLPCH